MLYSDNDDADDDSDHGIPLDAFLEGFNMSHSVRYSELDYQVCNGRTGPILKIRKPKLMEIKPRQGRGGVLRILWLL